MGKSKKQQAYEIIKAHLSQTMSAFPEEFARALVDAIEVMVGAPKKKGEKTEGAQVWDSYAEGIRMKYKLEPKRNATTNNQASQLANRLGVEDAIAVVQFYLSQTDAFYVRSYHPIGFCLKDAEVLYARMKTGRTITRKAADKIESAGATLSASSSYLSAKYGRRPTIPGEEEL